MTEPTKERTTDGHAALTAKIAEAVAILKAADLEGYDEMRQGIAWALRVLK
jgi:hypothetical protein